MLIPETITLPHSLLLVLVVEQLFQGPSRQDRAFGMQLSKCPPKPRSGLGVSAQDGVENVLIVAKSHGILTRQWSGGGESSVCRIRSHATATAVMQRRTISKLETRLKTVGSSSLCCCCCSVAKKLPLSLPIFQNRLGEVSWQTAGKQSLYLRPCPTPRRNLSGIEYLYALKII